MERREPADGCSLDDDDDDESLIESRSSTTRGITRTLGDGAETNRYIERQTSPRRSMIKDGDIDPLRSSNEDLSSLRCSSLQIEEVQNRRRNRQPSAGYPGLAFGSPMYSNTLFKFSLIANELKDLKHNQLRKVSLEWFSVFIFR